MLFYVFLVRAQFGPKTGGGRISPPLNEKRWKKCLMKLGLKEGVQYLKQNIDPSLELSFWTKVNN